MNATKREIVRIGFDYDPHKLLEYYYTLDHKDINDVKLTHTDEFDTIRDLKKSMVGKKHLQVDIRRDLVSECDKEHPLIKELLYEVFKQGLYDAEWGTVTFFLQKAGEDVPLHGDWPYRKNSLLIVPILIPPFEKTEAITYYKDGGEYMITSPLIMDVMAPHGVRNIDKDRLMLHVEIPNLTIEEVNDRIGI